MSTVTDNQDKPEVFGIFAEADGFDRPLIMLNLSFGRLMEEIVIPFQGDEAFFVDGVPLEKEKLKKLKILRIGKGFSYDFYTFNRQLKHGDDKTTRVFGDQYNVRIEAMLREHGEDVTSQVITAFNRKIKPSLKDYLPKREELIQGALNFFLNNLTQLAGMKSAA